MWGEAAFSAPRVGVGVGREDYSTIRVARTGGEAGPGAHGRRGCRKHGIHRPPRSPRYGLRKRRGHSHGCAGLRGPRAVGTLSALPGLLALQLPLSPRPAPAPPSAPPPRPAPLGPTSCAPLRLPHPSGAPAARSAFGGYPAEWSAYRVKQLVVKGDGRETEGVCGNPAASWELQCRP